MRKVLMIVLLLAMSTAYAGNYAYQQSGEVSFGWQSSDKWALYTSSGTLLPHTVASLNPGDGHYVTTHCIGWALVEHSTYYGGYPYSVNYQLLHSPYTALPIAYTNQTQSSNSNTEHLASYDFMTAHGTATDDALSLSYTHLGSILRIAAYVPEAKTFSSLTLSAKDNSAWFTSEATMNATNNTISATATIAKATLTLNNITVAAGDSLIAYMMLPPTDLSGKSMILSLNATDGSALQTYISGVNTQAGKVYPISVGKENYFKVSATSTSDDNTEEVLSLQADMGEKRSTEQITTATAYASDFTTDANHKLKPFLLGDVNFDGKVNVTDAVIVINHYQARTTEELDMNVSDINGDNNINVTDAVGIINIYQNRIQ
ncbi:MAG: fimbrillin family protein [Prevotella sp.]|nr:fimbrillin family protein [Prevotella sp.]MBO6234273.1 fimbrillin family protein [Prevotella sp.]